MSNTVIFLGNIFFYIFNFICFGLFYYCCCFLQESVSWLLFRMAKAYKILKFWKLRTIIGCWHLNCPWLCPHYSSCVELFTLLYLQAVGDLTSWVWQKPPREAPVKLLGGGGYRLSFKPSTSCRLNWACSKKDAPPRSQNVACISRQVWPSYLKSLCC